MPTQRQLVELATDRLRKGGWQVVVVSLAGNRHKPPFGWLDVVAVNGPQRTCLALCVDRPAKHNRTDDPLPRVLASPAARAWLSVPGNQLEVWRVFPETVRGQPAKIDRHPISLASLARPGPPQPTLSWADAFGSHGEGGGT
jgi:hypothetical protein